jgi:bifunctional UDP-N-acetylglucosamine pyrophosphorylase / glucosamine-1-phosphate N-acetyltransferase
MAAGQRAIRRQGTISTLAWKFQRAAGWNGPWAVPFKKDILRDGAFAYFRVMFKPTDLFDLSQTDHAALFEGCEHAWEALKKIKDYLAAHLKPELRNRCQGVAFIGEDVFIGEGSEVEDGVMIKGPAIIGKNCQIRHNAYLRENVILGDQCVVGNSTELKNVLFFNQAVAPHFNYLGDTILGCKAHLGAGVKISNVKVVPGNVTVEVDGQPFDTGLRKFGALVGDRSEIGCNAVLNPGSIIGRGAVVYPNTNWRGILPAHMIAKNKAEVQVEVLRVRTTT